MATLTIADLDNGKRDLQTVAEVATSRAAAATTRFGQQTTTLYESIRRINATGDEILSNLGFRVPVPYDSGLNVTDSRFTVTGPDDKVYAPLSAPFTTGAWDPSQWYVLQNDLNDKKLLVFDTLLAAQAAATVLPDGQDLSVKENLRSYSVLGGILSAERPTFPAGVGTADRSQQERNTDVVSVKDDGALGNGSDSTIAFGLSARRAIAAIPASDASTQNIERAPVATVHVPAGKYVLTEVVDTANRDVRWVFEDGTEVVGYQQYLPGIIYREGNKVSAETYGTGDYATAFKIYANHSNKEQMAGISGFQTPSAVASRYGRDSCGQAVEVVAPPILASVANCTFSASRVNLSAPLSVGVVRRLRKGMILDTSEPAGQFKFSGFVIGWDSAGSWIEVSGWFQYGGGGTATTPPNGLTVYVSPITNALGQITYATLNADSHANRVLGGEIDIVNNKIAPVAYPLAGAFLAGDNSPDLIGRLISSFGSVGKGTAALKTEGDWIYGAYIRNADYGLWYNKTGGTALVAGRGAAKILRGDNSSGKEEIYLSNNRLKFKAGANGTATVSLIDFVTGGSDIDYDVRIQASSGNGTVGNGSLSFTSGDIRLLAGTTMFGGTLRPFADNAYSIGTTIFRPTQIFAMSSTINTSDEREKEAWREQTAAEKAAALEIKSVIRAFKFIGRTRTHFGVGAQTVGEILRKHGLNPEDYAFWCYDEWDEVPDSVDDAGNVIEAGHAAGSRYGIRYEELLAFIIAAL